MARIPSFQAQQTKSVIPAAAQASLSAADTGGAAIGRGLQALGGGISSAGQAFDAIVDADNKNKDLSAEAELSRAVKESDLGYEAEKVTTKVDNLPKLRKKYDDTLSQLAGQLSWGTADAKNAADGVITGFARINQRKLVLDTAERNAQVAQIATKRQYEDQFLAMDLTGHASTEHQEEQYRESLKFQYTPEQIDAIVQKSTDLGMKNRTERDFNVAVGSAFDTWSTTKDLSTAFDQINKDPRIEEKDKQEAESELKSRVTIREAEEEKVKTENDEVSLKSINESMYIDIDYGVAKTKVNESDIPEKEKATLYKEINRRAELASQGKDITNDPEAVDNVYTAISRAGEGGNSLAAAKDVIKKNQGKMSNATITQAYKDLNREFDSNTDSAYNNIRTQTKQRAIGPSENLIDQLLAVVVGQTGDAKAAAESEVVSAREKFNLELDNFNRWEASMWTWRDKNPDATSSEIQKQGQITWTTTFGKNVDKIDVLKETSAMEARKNEQARTGQVRETKPVKSAQAESSGRVIMINPKDGKPYGMRSDQVKAALNAGWTRR